jgi:hypothetical protein
MADLPGSTNQQIGRMDGRLTALESRLDRHEIFVTAKLNAIDTKLDEALMMQVAGIGNSKAIRWIIGLAISVAAWFAGHLTQLPPNH